MQFHLMIGEPEMDRMPHSARCLLSALRMPRAAPRPLRCMCRTMLILAVPLWVPVITAFWMRSDWYVMGTIRTLAAIALMIAGMCWAVSWMYDADRRMLSRALADALRRLPDAERRDLLIRKVQSGR